jgi:hypothetical protein
MTGCWCGIVAHPRCRRAAQGAALPVANAAAPGSVVIYYISYQISRSLGDEHGLHCLNWPLACCCFHAVQQSPPLRGLARAWTYSRARVPTLATGCGWRVSLHCATAPWLAHVAACVADYCSGGCSSSRPAASAPSLHLSERQPAGPSLAVDQGAASRCEMQALRACWSRCTTPADFAPMRVAWV